MKVFLIAPKELYTFINENINDITKKYSLENSDLIMPYDFEKHYFLNKMINHNSQNFLIESDQFVRHNNKNYNFNEEELQHLRLAEAKKRAYKHWLKAKLKYSIRQLIKSDAYLTFNHLDIDEIASKELRDEINVAKQLDKKNINGKSKVLYLKKHG